MEPTNPLPSLYPPLERMDPQLHREWIYRGCLRTHIERYAFLCEHVRGKRVLDIACGTGYGTAMLAETATQVTGMDVSEEAVKDAATRYARPNVTFTAAPAVRVPLPDESIDVVVSFETIEHLQKEEVLPFLLEMRRLMRPGATLWLSTPDRFAASLGTPAVDFHIQEFTEQELRALLEKAHFTVTGAFGQTVIAAWQIRMGMGTLRVFPQWLVLKLWRLWIYMLRPGKVVPMKNGHSDSATQIILEALRS